MRNRIWFFLAHEITSDIEVRRDERRLYMDYDHSIPWKTYFSSYVKPSLNFCVTNFLTPIYLNKLKFLNHEYINEYTYICRIIAFLKKTYFYHFNLLKNRNYFSIISRIPDKSYLNGQKCKHRLCKDTYNHKYDIVFKIHLSNMLK